MVRVCDQDYFDACIKKAMQDSTWGAEAGFCGLIIDGANTSRPRQKVYLSEKMVTEAEK